MPRFPEKEEAAGGSRKWMQILVNDHRDVLDRALVDASGGGLRGPVRWFSPLREDEWAEYRDQSFVDLLGLTLVDRPLNTFWPAGGPQWSALGLAKDGAPVLVEGNAHESDVATDCTARGAASQAKMRKSFREAQQHYRVDPTCNWMNGYFQYATRIAHLYLLREQNRVPAWMVFLWVVGDKETGAASRASWERVRKRIHRSLGLPDAVPGAVDAYVEAKALTAATAGAPRGKQRR